MHFIEVTCFISLRSWHLIVVIILIKLLLLEIARLPPLIKFVVEFSSKEGILSVLLCFSNFLAFQEFIRRSGVQEKRIIILLLLLALFFERTISDINNMSDSEDSNSKSVKKRQRRSVGSVKYVKDDSDDDSNNSVDSSPKKKKHQSKKKPVKNDSDSDNRGTSSDDQQPAKKKRPVAVKKGASSARNTKSSKKRVDSDNEEDGSEDSDRQGSDDENSNNSDSDTSQSSENSNDNNKIAVKKDKEVKQKKSSTSSNSTKKHKSSSGSRSGSSIMKKADRLEEARKAYKWWEATEHPGGLLWKKLEHPGVLFPPPYVRHNVPLKYDNKEVTLNNEQEEVASFYAAIPEDGPQLGNPKTRSVFQENFFKEFKETLPVNHVIQKFDKCDFSQIKEYLTLQRNLKKAATDEEKNAAKAVKQAIQLRYGYALIDGRMEKVISK